MTMTERDKRTLIVGGAALAVMLATYFGVIPFTQSWAEARQRIASAEVELRLHEQRSVSQAAQHARLAQHFGAGVGSPLPSLDAARLNLVNDVEAALKAANVNIEHVVPQPGRPLRDADNLTRLAVRVDATCNLVDLARALARLEAADRLIIVDRVHATAVENRPGQVNASLTLTTLARTPEQRP